MPRAFPAFDTRRVDPITIAASTWRWDGSSGSVLVSSGFPLKPGQVRATTLTQVRVYVDGVEQAVALHPLDGTFPDGSYRSVGIQFAYPLTDDTPVDAQVKINQGTRGTSDLAWVEPTVATHVSKKAVIAPTDPVHLCGTYVTLAPLTPATNDTGVGADFAAAATAKWTGTTASGANSGTATYDFWNGLWAMYCRTGTRSWYQWAYDWSTQIALGGSIANSTSHLLIPHNLPVTPGEGPPGNCTNQPLYNPEAIVGLSNCGVEGNEAYGMRYLAYVAAYWMTAWRQPKRSLAMMVQHGLRKTPTGYTLTRDFWISDKYGIRFNLTNGHLWPIVAAYLTGCTTPFAFAGTPALPSHDYVTFLPWIIDALADYTWTLGDYRDGLVGLSTNVITDATLSGEYGITNFQLSLIGEFLMAYYDHVTPDARIPGMMQKIADYIIAQTRAATPEEIADEAGIVYVTPYNNLDPAIIAVSTFTASVAAAGTNVGATTDATGYPSNGTSASTVTLAAAGTGSILVGDAITFAGQATVYRVTVEVANVAAGGPITFVRAASTYPPTPLPGLAAPIPAAPTLITTTGTRLMTWTGGPVPCDEETLMGVDFYGPGITAASRTHPVVITGSALCLNTNVTATAGATFHTKYHAWYHAMFPSIVAWVGAYTGNATYLTWADRYALPDNSAAILQTKNWGEIYGGSRLSYLYYRNGGAVRGTPGVHPTSIVNPPAQPTLG